MAETFRLPGSSYEELTKIIKAYATGKVGTPMSLETVAQTAGMDKTVVSRNNGFLVQMAFVSEGNKKSPTQLGIDLGRAYALNISSEIVRIWRSAVEADEFLSRMLSAIRIRNGMEKSSFINHILYSSGGKTSNNARAGANTIIEIYKTAQLATEEDGRIIALEVERSFQDVGDGQALNSFETEPVGTPIPVTKISSGNVTININIDVTVAELDTLAPKIKSLIDSLNETD